MKGGGQNKAHLSNYVAYTILVRLDIMFWVPQVREGHFSPLEACIYLGAYTNHP